MIWRTKRTDIENKELLHQVYLERYKNSVVNKCLNILKQAEKLISNELKKTDGVYTKKRYKEFLVVLRNTARSLKENVLTEFELDDFLSTELEKQQKIIGDTALISVITPTVEKVKTAALFSPITENKTFQNFLDGLESQFYTTWDSAVRTGYLTGMTTRQIVSNVLGTIPKNGQVAKIGNIETLRKSLVLNTRTAIQSFAECTRGMVYDSNKEYFSGYKFLATLDRRTCLVCGSFDGQVRKNRTDFPLLPVHYNCRCLTIPVVKNSVVDIEEERASENGPVSAKLTYENWIKQQPVSIQKEILGDKRFEMLQRGFKIQNFVSDNKQLSLEQLKMF